MSPRLCVPLIRAAAKERAAKEREAKDDEGVTIGSLAKGPSAIADAAQPTRTPSIWRRATRSSAPPKVEPINQPLHNSTSPPLQTSADKPPSPRPSSSGASDGPASPERSTHSQGEHSSVEGRMSDGDGGEVDLGASKRIFLYRGMRDVQVPARRTPPPISSHLLRQLPSPSSSALLLPPLPPSSYFLLSSYLLSLAGARRVLGQGRYGSCSNEYHLLPCCRHAVRRCPHRPWPHVSYPTSLPLVARAS